MRSYKIESYVPEDSFLLGKDARFCRAAFKDCFVIDIHNSASIIASCRGENGTAALSTADRATLLTLFHSSDGFLMLPCSQGTLLVYPAWSQIGLALGFLFEEDFKTVEKAYQTAKRYAFSMIFDTDSESKINQQLSLETKLCTLQFYMERLFGNKRETNVMAQILMIANLVGCRLHEMSVARVSVTLDEVETERMSAYLCCVFMTMRRYNGKVSATAESDQNTSILTHVPQEYGVRIQQSIGEKVLKPTSFDHPNKKDIASFATHSAFRNYQIEEVEGSIRLRLPIKQKALLSFFTTRGGEQEITLVLFPV